MEYGRLLTFNNPNDTLFYILLPLKRSINDKIISPIKKREGRTAGMIPIDVDEYQIDVLAGCGFKWLLGMHGTGFLYVSNRVIKMIHPVLPGMYAAERIHDKLSLFDDARKFETGTIAYSLFDAWSEGLQLVLAIGVENIYNKALENTDLIIDGLLKKEYKII